MGNATKQDAVSQSELIELLEATCGDCGSDMELVRPGKWQCPKCELDALIKQAQAEGWERCRAKIIEAIARCEMPNYQMAMQLAKLSIIKEVRAVQFSL